MDPKKRILVVDDEPSVLDDLKRVQQGLCKDWDFIFEESGPAGLERMARQPVHVVISDLRMPSMSGLEFLRCADRSSPETVRVALAGNGDRDLMIQCLGMVHQFIAKPCDPERIKSAIHQIGTLGDLYASENVKRLVAQAGRLPAVPALYKEVCAKLESETAGPEDVARVISRDPGMTAHVLRMANSSYFGLRREVVKVEEAVFFLGTEALKAIILYAGLFKDIGRFETTPFNVRHLWGHTISVATAARRIATLENASKQTTDVCFTAGLLHDAGMLLLASRFSDEYQEVNRIIQEEGTTIASAEHTVFGVTHPEVGAYLLGLWGLPKEVIRPVAWHHVPSFEAARGFTPTVAVHVADVLSGGPGFHPIFSTSRIDELCLGSLGLQDRIASWAGAIEG